MRTKTWMILVLALMLAGIQSYAHAAISGTSGDITVGTLPANLTTPTTNIFAFEEQQNVVLGSNLTLNLLLPGSTYSGLGTTGTNTTIAAGTVVDSYLIHEFIGSVNPLASITFDGGTVIGVIWTPTGFLATDGIFGIPGTVYPTTGLPDSRRIEFGNDITFSDYLTVTSTGISNLYMYSDEFSDEARVLVASVPEASVPEPSTILLLGSGLVGLIGYGRRRLKK